MLITSLLSLSILTGMDKEPTYVENEKDIAIIILQLEKTPKESIEIRMNGKRGKEIYHLYSEALDGMKSELIEDYKLFYSYSSDYKGYVLRITETTPNRESLTDMKSDYDTFIDSIVTQAQTHQGNETAMLFSVYDSVFNRLEYSANSSHEMNAGNYFNGITSCVGFSKILSDSFDKLGLENTINYSDSHYWNVVMINNTETIVDMATDKLLKSKYKSLGTSTSEHANLVTALPYSTIWFTPVIETNKEVTLTAITLTDNVAEVNLN